MQGLVSSSVPTTDTSTTSSKAIASPTDPAVAPKDPVPAQSILPVALDNGDSWINQIVRMALAGSPNKELAQKRLMAYQAMLDDNLEKTWAFIKDLPRDNIEEALIERARGKMKIDKPVWFASNFQTDVAALQFGATGMSVSPCAIPISPVGAAVDPTAINVGLQLISVSPQGVNVQPQDINISPSLIVVGPYDTSVSAQGLNIAPTLISVAPTMHVVDSSGPLDVSPVGKTVTLPPLPSLPGNFA